MGTDPRTRAFFGAKAREYYQESYEAPRDRHAYNLTLRREACLALVPEGGGPILDLGCGPGAMTIPLLQRGREVASVDLSHEMVMETSRRAIGLGAELMGSQASAAALPFGDATFAVVVSTGVLEYVPEIDAALREVARVLQPGGCFIGTMSMPRRLERAAVRALSRLRGNANQTTQYIYGRGEFDRLVEQAGLRLTSRESCTFMPFPLDALWPAGVLWVDRHWSDSLNRIDFACDHAKTYIVKAFR